MDGGISLADVLQVSGSGGLALGAFLGALMPGRSGKEIADNVIRYSTIGLVLGVVLGFALAGALALNGNVR